MGFLDDCRSLFGSTNLYQVLKISNGGKSTSASNIKKAYYAQSLLYHPDKVTNGPETSVNARTEKFQILSRAYSILSDKDKRAVYDETGAIDDEDIVSENSDWLGYWRGLFKKVTIEDIINFQKSYKGSEEELYDLRLSYDQHKGNMTRIGESMPCCDDGPDLVRYADILDKLIDEGELESTSAYKRTTRKGKTPAQKRKAEKEAKEAEEALEQLQTKGLGSLEDAIARNSANRSKTFDNMLNRIADKYANDSPKSAKGKKRKT